MGYLRTLLGIVLIAVAIELLAPLLSVKTGILLPMIQQNCGAVPVFLRDIAAVNQSPDPRYWRGFVTCGAGFMGFLLMPGFLKIVSFIYGHVISTARERTR